MIDFFISIHSNSVVSSYCYLSNVLKAKISLQFSLVKKLFNGFIPNEKKRLYLHMAHSALHGFTPPCTSSFALHHPCLLFIPTSLELFPVPQNVIMLLFKLFSLPRILSVIFSTSKSNFLSPISFPERTCEHHRKSFVTYSGSKHANSSQHLTLLCIN